MTATNFDCFIIFNCNYRRFDGFNVKIVFLHHITYSLYVTFTIFTHPLHVNFKISLPLFMCVKHLNKIDVSRRLYLLNGYSVVRRHLRYLVQTVSQQYYHSSPSNILYVPIIVFFFLFYLSMKIFCLSTNCFDSSWDLRAQIEV